MKRLCSLFSLLLLSTAALAAPSLTVVTVTLTDATSQIWTNANWTTQFVPPFGNPALPNNNGSAIKPTQTGLSDGTGTFTVTLDDNNVVAPAGSKWSFVICPNATVPSCSTIALVVTGPTMNLSTQISAALTTPSVAAAPTLVRSYNDSQTNGGIGALYVNTISGALKMCNLQLCQGTGWVSTGYNTNNPVFTGTMTLQNFIASGTGEVDGLLTVKNCIDFYNSSSNSVTLCPPPSGGNINVTLPNLAGTLAILASPAFTGTPTAPTPTAGDNSTKLATTAFVFGQGFVTSATSPVTSVFGRTGAVISNNGDYTVSQVTGAAPLASPTFTGTPAAPTPSPGDNSTNIATTAFVHANSGVAGLSFTKKTLAAGLSPSSGVTTTITSQAITMPSSGCPCRAEVHWGVDWQNSVAGVVDIAMFDGTNNYASGELGLSGSFTSGTGMTGGGVSTVTYNNSANITFSLRINTNATGGGGFNIQTTPASSLGEGTWFSVLIFASN